jgi:small nuclear ribonucleoprotein (snRNP)-like protein
LASKEQLAAMNFRSLSSTAEGDGDMFYAPIEDEFKRSDEKEVTVILQYNEDRKLTAQLPGMDVPDDFPRYRKEVSRVRLKCAENKMVIVKSEAYDAMLNLVHMNAVEFSTEPNWIQPGETSPLGLLLRIVCTSNEVAK